MKLEIILNKENGKIKQIAAVEEHSGIHWLFDPKTVKIEQVGDGENWKAFVEFDEVSWILN